MPGPQRRPPALGVAAAVALVTTACGGGTSAPDRPARSTVTAAPTSAAVAPTTVTIAAPAPPTWQNRASAPTSRQEVASAVVDGRVWVVGGITAAGASTVVESYDPATDQWAPGPALPLALHHAAATTYHGELAVLGGFLDAATLYARATDRAFTLRAGAWVELPRLRRPRGAAAAAVVGDSLVLVGGRDSSGLVSPTEVYDGSAWRDATAIPSPRDHLSAVSDGRSLFAVGGRMLDPGATTGALDRFDPAANAWERLPGMPTARGGLGAAFTGGRIVVAGGEDATAVFAQVESYDVAAARWSALPPLPFPRHGMAVERVGPSVVALVGGTAAGVAPSRLAEVLSPV